MIMDLTKHSVYFVSLGCPKNLVDSQIISGCLLAQGAAWAYTPDEATLYIINTCAFLPEAREEACREIEEAVNWKNSLPGDRRIIVCGCLSQYDKDSAFASRYPEVDVWAGVDDLERIADIVENKAQVSRTTEYLYTSDTPALQLTMPHTAYIKISDGCNNFCSYCAIPNLRGRVRSRRQDDIVREAENLIANGASELIITAQDITVYGCDHPERKENIATLLTALDELEGDFGIRLLYTHPAHYTDEFFDVLGRMKHLIPYIDIPLQHISDRILKSMNRHVDQPRIREIIGRLRETVPGITIRTTFITGLPGESEEEFAELENFLKEMKFDRVGVFPFSPEPGTPAAGMPDQIPFEIAEKRAAKLMANQKKRMRSANRKLIGTVQQVTIDSVEEGYAVARGNADAPDIDNLIYVDTAGRRVKNGQKIEVEVCDIDGSDLIAVICRGKRKK